MTPLMQAMWKIRRHWLSLAPPLRYVAKMAAEKCAAIHTQRFDQERELHKGGRPPLQIQGQETGFQCDGPGQAFDSSVRGCREGSANCKN